MYYYHPDEIASRAEVRQVIIETLKAASQPMHAELLFSIIEFEHYGKYRPWQVRSLLASCVNQGSVVWRQDGRYEVLDKT